MSHIHAPGPCHSALRPSALKEPYFVWPTNDAYHQNLARAITAIKYYFERHDGQLDVAIIGPWSDRLRENFEVPHLVKFKDVYSSIPRRFKRKMRFLSNLNNEYADAVFAHADFIWQNAMCDNGTALAVKCGEFGVPLVSADYPQTRHLIETFKLEAKLFDPYRPEQAAMALKQAEVERAAGTFRGRLVLAEGYESELREGYAAVLKRLLAEPAPQVALVLPSELHGSLS